MLCKYQCPNTNNKVINLLYTPKGSIITIATYTYIMCIKIYLHSPRSILGRPQAMPVSAAGRDIEVYLELCQRLLLVLNIQNRDVGDRRLDVGNWKSSDGFLLVEFNIISSWPSFQCTTTIEHQEGSLPLPFTAVRLSGWTSQMLPDILMLSIVSYCIALFTKDHAKKNRRRSL